MVLGCFAGEARESVDQAVEEARLLGHDSVGDEDLLLGLLSADDGMAAQALASLGVSREMVSEKSDEQLAEALSSVGVSLEEARAGAGEAFDMQLPRERRIPFSPRAKKALEQSLSEALRLKDNRIISEHVLLGILRNEDGTAARILAALDVQTAAVEERLDQLRGRVS